jgi:ArsR family transcriptional regulator
MLLTGYLLFVPISTDVDIAQIYVGRYSSQPTGRPRRIDVCQYEAMRKRVEPVDTGCALLFFDPLDRRSAEEMAAALRVLADPARLRILNLIANHPRSEVCQAEFTKPLGLSQPTVSHHLKVLHEAGLVHREQRGSWAYYSLVPDQIEGLLAALSLSRREPVPHA